MWLTVDNIEEKDSTVIVALPDVPHIVGSGQSVGGVVSETVGATTEVDDTPIQVSKVAMYPSRTEMPLCNSSNALCLAANVSSSMLAMEKIALTQARWIVFLRHLLMIPPVHGNKRSKESMRSL
jgi:hypothetical protein